MQIRGGTPIYYLMVYWPFILSGITALFFSAKLNLVRLILLFMIGVLVGYGVSTFLVMPASAFFSRAISEHISQEKLGAATLVFHYASSVAVTTVFLLLLGGALHVGGQAPRARVSDLER